LASAELNATDASGDFAYYFRLCGAVQSAAAGTCLEVSPNSAACQMQIAGAGKRTTFDLGDWDSAAPAQWSYIDASVTAKGVQYTLTGSRQWSVAHAEWGCQ